MKQNKPWYDINGGVWMTLFSAVTLGICVHAYFTGKEIPSALVTVYGLVLGAFATHKTVAKMVE